MSTHDRVQGTEIRYYRFELILTLLSSRENKIAIEMLIYSVKALRMS